MKKYEVKAKYVFEGTWSIAAESVEDAIRNFKEGCSVSNPSISSSLPYEDVDWDIDPHPVDVEIIEINKKEGKKQTTSKNKLPLTKVVKVCSDGLCFDNGYLLTSHHEQDCCEDHFLGLSDLSLEDFDGLEFDLTDDSFFERIEGYGIALCPIKGFPIRIPSYACNNGHYSANLTLVISNGTDKREYDITECQHLILI